MAVGKPRLVVAHQVGEGLGITGKSTLAPVLARPLGLPLVAEDTIKDALMSVLPFPM